MSISRSNVLHDILINSEDSKTMKYVKHEMHRIDQIFEMNDTMSKQKPTFIRKPNVGAHLTVRGNLVFLHDKYRNTKYYLFVYGF